MCVQPSPKQNRRLTNLHPLVDDGFNLRVADSRFWRGICRRRTRWTVGSHRMTSRSTGSMNMRHTDDNAGIKGQGEEQSVKEHFAYECCGHGRGGNSRPRPSQSRRGWAVGLSGWSYGWHCSGFLSAVHLTIEATRRREAKRLGGGRNAGTAGTNQHRRSSHTRNVQSNRQETSAGA